MGGAAVPELRHTPALAVAIHAGHNVREELLPLLQISEKDHLFEEDPATDRMIRGTANAIWGLDSRAEYDLNRPVGQAVPLTAKQFWGVQVYRAAPADAMVQRSLEKYEAFYRFAGSCIRVLLERFGFCVVYDIHSYNISRQVEKGIVNPPLFNLGTALLDRPRWGERIDAGSTGVDRKTGSGREVWRIDLDLLNTRLKHEVRGMWKASARAPKGGLRVDLCVFASNTSSIPIVKVAVGLPEPTVMVCVTVPS